MSELDFSAEAKEFLRAQSDCRSQKLSFYEKLEKLLCFLVEAHNEKNLFKTSLDSVKSVYKRGTEAFAIHYKPDTTKAQWGICRVNCFLKMLRGSKETNLNYVFFDIDVASKCKHFPKLLENIPDLKPNNNFFDFDETEFALARVALARFDIYESIQNNEDENLFLSESERKTLNKPFRLPKGSSKKFGVYVKNPKTGNIIIVKFGDPNMEIKRDNPERRRSFRARHKCHTAKDKTTPRYWSCKFWSKKPVSKSVSSDAIEWDEEEILTEWGWDESSFVKLKDLISEKPELQDLLNNE